MRVRTKRELATKLSRLARYAKNRTFLPCLLPGARHTQTFADSQPRMIAKNDSANFRRPSKLQDVLVLHQQGDLPNAEKGYRAILRIDSRDFDATYLLGLVLLQKGEFEKAEAQFRRAIKINPRVANAFHDHGNALLEIDRPADAVAQYNKAIALDPTLADAFNNRGNALIRLGRFDEAVTSFDRAIALNPTHAMAYYNRGNALRRLGRHDEALASYQQAIATRPDYAEAYNNCGNSLLELQKPDAALAAYDKAIAIDPFFAEAHCNRAAALIDLRHYKDALAASDRAVALNADFPDAWRARGDCLRNLERYDESLAAYDQALSLSPNLADAWAGRAFVLHALKRHADAMQSWTKLLRYAPDYNFAKGRLAYQKLMACDWSGLAELAQSIEQDVRAGRNSAEPFGYQALSRSAKDLRRCAELFIEKEFPPTKTSLWRPRTRSPGKIRIGYLSGEFRQHATSILITQLFELHDKNKFEIFAYDNGYDDRSEIRRRINAAFHRVADITSISDAQAVARIRADEIDILVNLNGFFGRARTGVFRDRAAPVQVNYLGFPGTIGADYIDYIIADQYVIPREHEQFYVEKVVLLPECYQVNDSKRPIYEIVETRSTAMLPDDGFVYCCFNNSYKITQDVFELWMRLLKKNDKTTLWLVEDNADATHNLRREANECGVSPERLVFAPRVDLAEHLARHRLADLFVDTLPYNAHTTASDALWAGLPLLTCIGSTFPGRVGASLLHAIGMPELITQSLEEYERLALRLAQEPALLRSFKIRLAENRDRCPLFDTKQFARHIEAAYLTMWERHRSGEPPVGFAVPRLVGISGI
jgi:protein O-GlcNAc transferase